MQNRNHIVEILLDVDGLPPPTPEIQHERELAIYELLQENVFVLDRRGEKILPSAPLVLKLSMKNSLLAITVEGKNYEGEYEVGLSLTALKPIIKDYFEICKSYFNAVKRLPPSQIEVIDMGRRGIHLEGSRVLMERLSGKVKTDIPTAKRLFSLICALHIY